MDRKKIREIYYGIVDPDEKAIWRMLMKAYYHKVSEKEIMKYLIYYRRHSEDYAHRLIKEIREMWLRLEWIKVKEK